MRVDNGARTRDLRDHNQVLYQLSYIHHAEAIGTAITASRISYRTSKRLRDWVTRDAV